MGLIPVIGVLKNVDEIGDLAKGAKNVEDFKIVKSIKVEEKAEVGNLSKAGEELKKVDDITEGASKADIDIKPLNEAGKLKSNVNLSQYKKIENQWAKAIEEGKNVKVKVETKYDGNRLRPSEFNVQYEIDGKYFERDILN